MKFRDKGGTKLVFTTAVILVMLALITSPASASRIQLEKYVTNPNGFEEGDVIDFTIFVGNPATNPYINTQDVTDYMPDGTVVVLEYNLVLNPGESTIYHVQHTVTAADVVAGEVINTVRLDGSDSNEDIIEAATQARADITEQFEPPESDEFWAVEWFETLPHQYTQFNLPEDQDYLVTLSWFAPESSIHIWDGEGQDEPLDAYEGSRVKFLHTLMGDDGTDQDGLNGDIYFDPEEGTVRVYGTFGEGPGDHDFIDPETGLKPENPPYTDPIAPFFPQAEQAPNKDHITFNPAMMDHNDPDFKWYNLLDFGINYEGEKVFKRMSYEKDWFKDHNLNGCYDIVMTDGSDEIVVCLEDTDLIHHCLEMGYWPMIHNNRPTVDGQTADIYGPALIQDFTYMFLDDLMPTPIVAGSSVLIPMASYQDGNGIDSFIPTMDGPRGGMEQAVEVQSEETLGMDIDGDGIMEPMDPDGKDVNGDESVVLVLRNQGLQPNQELQFFDHIVKVMDVFDDGKAVFQIEDNEGEGYNYASPFLTMSEGEVKYFYRAKEGGSPTEAPAFYLKLVAADSVSNRATFEVGRMFGNVGANIAANKYHTQKAFWVDDVFYNVVAIKAYPDNMIKYITIRQKLPKMDIKVHDHHFKVWEPFMTLPELPPFNMDHKVHEDVQELNKDEIVKVGPLRDARPLKIHYTWEDEEERFWGELKEIYTENCEEFWAVEWFLTLPWQYTEIHIDERFCGEKWMLTSAFFAPESCIHLWDGGEEDGPMFAHEGDRVKFWFDRYYDPLYIDDGELRVYGTFGEGPGDHNFVDPETQLKPENAPYTDVMGPFYPQSDQAPVKDHVTFNPAIMDHNDPEFSWYSLLDFGVNYEGQKVFKRMSYEKEWFKDHNLNGCYDVVMTNGANEVVVCLDDKDLVHDYYEMGYWIVIANNDPNVDGQVADIYAPAIIQDFTYMFLNDNMPAPVTSGSSVLIPMASHTEGVDDTGDGIDSFAPIVRPDGSRPNAAVQVESEDTLGIDIDGDGIMEVMEPDATPLNGNEHVVLVLRNQGLQPGMQLQFFDHIVELVDVFDDGTAIFNVLDNEGPGYSKQSWGVTMTNGDVKTFYRAKEGGSPTEAPAFYIKLVAVDSVNDRAIFEVGRMFGQAGANIAANKYHSQKAFWVDSVFYNVVAIRAYPDNDVKYITIRQKLPKFDVKVHDHHFKVWDSYVTLPELPPFNMHHAIHVDIQHEWSHDKIGPLQYIGPLEISYTAEEEEPRFSGELKEIYWEIDNGPGAEEPCPWDLTGDDIVNIDDVKELVANYWGSSGACDFNEDGTTNIEDVKILVYNWGTCPTT